MTPAARTLYVVTRAGIEVTNSGDLVPLLQIQVTHQPRTDADNGYYRVPEAAFADRAAAESDARRRELTARELLNPLTIEWGHLETLTSLTPQQLRAEIAARDLAPPEPVVDQYQDERNLALWWDAESANWTAALRAELWELFDKVKLYDVQEVPFE